ncbi:MAG TPA: glycosyl hydrolase family 18 protein [Acidimicrobiales bacterium]|jgi:hypothetical protein|nr:glycosyl hydrolase family 18 protein [Acidimicrobiales bacterium]
MVRNRRARLLRTLLSLLAIAVVGGVLIVVTSGPHLTPEQIAAQQEAARLHRQFVAEQTAADRAKLLVSAALPTRATALAPTAVAPLFKAPLAAHHVVGYVPYWEVSSLQPADFADASELVYSSVCPAADGSITGQPGADCALGLADLSGSGVAGLIAQAHAEGDKVLLSVETTHDALIESLDAHASSVAPTLAANLVSLEHLYGFDGTNIDFEGTKPADRASFVRFATALTGALRVDSPSGEILIDTYAAAAAGPQSFFDPKRLAPLADALFVMNYSLQSNDYASPGAPLVTSDLGYSAVQSLIEYKKVVPANKIILGVPFYGFDFTTSTSRPHAAATSVSSRTYYRSVLAPTPIVTAANPALWDPVSATPFSRYETAGKWHQLWFEDPVSIALKVALASQMQTAGVGAWAFGMEGGDPLMLAALTGDSAPLRTSFAG